MVYSIFYSLFYVAYLVYAYRPLFRCTTNLSVPFRSQESMSRKYFSFLSFIYFQSRDITLRRVAQGFIEVCWQ